MLTDKNSNEVAYPRNRWDPKKLLVGCYVCLDAHDSLGAPRNELGTNDVQREKNEFFADRVRVVIKLKHHHSIYIYKAYHVFHTHFLPVCGPTNASNESPIRISAMKKRLIVTCLKPIDMWIASPNQSDTIRKPSVGYVCKIYC